MASLRPDVRRGLTLAEIILSAGILTTVLVLLIGVFVGGLKLMQRSEVHTAAATIAREVLETIQDEGGIGCLPLENSSFNGANPDPALDGFPPAPYPVTTRDGREYVIRIEVLEEPIRQRMCTVLVTVSWDGGRIQLEKGFHAADSAL